MTARRRIPRFRLFWLGLALAAVGMGVAVNRLYETARREIADQGNRALHQAHSRAQERIREYTDLVRRTIVEELSSFHLEGLGRALRQWDDANTTITGTFQWTENQGFDLESNFPPQLVEANNLPEFWNEFRAWRASNSANTYREPFVVGNYRSVVYNTLDTANFPAGSLRYQAENLEILSYAGRATDPWCGWAAHMDDPSAPWVFWYQAGPESPVRGCFVSVEPIVETLRSELTDKSVAQIGLVASRSLKSVGRGDEVGTLFDWLPAYTLSFDLGEIFLEKQTNVRFSALIVVLLVGLFSVGVAFLSLFSRKEARDAERKTTFVSQVSHELRTPLTSIRMFADMLAAPDVTEEKRAKFAGTISRESQRLGAMIERLLTFNALEKGKLSVRIEPVDVTAIVRETLEEMEATLAEAGMRAEADLPKEVVVASTDRSAVKQVLLNLIDNAVKYARDGKLVQVQLVRSIDRITLRVTDHGPGIANSLRARVFDPFVQGGRTLTDKSPGVGLGLSIAREMLRATGGDLVLISSPSGAAFEMRLANLNTPR
jgi:signal transduction histidine kinase